MEAVSLLGNVREYLGLIGVQQEITNVATPEENAHIEAFNGNPEERSL